MSFIKRVFFALMVLCSVSYANSEEEKHYVDINNVVLQGNGILVFTEEGWVGTEALYTDANGLYISHKWPWTPFICSNCGTPNPPFNFVCGSCGTARGD